MAIDPVAQLAIDDARAICAIEAPPFAEGRRGAFVAERFAALGLAVRTDAIGNVIAVLPGEIEPPVVFAAHLDTVFAAGTPLVFEEQSGRLHAPGIGDNSLGVAGLLHLARASAGRTLKRSVALVATVGEEGLGDLRGAKALVAELPMEAFVAVEGAMVDQLEIAAVGSVRFRVTVRGPGGHPWSDRGTRSAVDGLLDALTAARAAAPSTEAEIGLNAGTIRGGTAINVIAAEATAELDLRCEDDRELVASAGRVRAALLAEASDGLVVDVEQIGHRPGGGVAADHPLIEAARHARRVAGLPPAIEGSSSTDANAAYGRGIPAITVGITTGGAAHTTGEYIDLAPVAGGLRALTALAMGLAGG